MFCRVSLKKGLRKRLPPVLFVGRGDAKQRPCMQNQVVARRDLEGGSRQEISEFGHYIRYLRF